MSGIIVLTPIVIASWPAITAAVAGAAASMGFTLRPEDLAEPEEKLPTVVETEIAEAEVVGAELARGQKIVIRRSDVRLEIGQDERGRCKVCASGFGHSERELRKIADEVSGRIVQQFVYHKLLTELQNRSATVLEQQRLADDSVRVKVRL